MPKEKDSQTYIQGRQSNLIDQSCNVISDMMRYGKIQVKMPNKDMVARAEKNDYHWVDVPNAPLHIIRNAERIIRSFNPDEGPNSFIENLKKKTFEEMQEIILSDGITPHIQNIEGLKHYIITGADFSNVDPEDPEVKKKREGYSAPDLN